MDQVDLRADFPELFHPEVNLAKEILAHFGLVFSGFALLEAALQNCFCVWKLDHRLRNVPLPTAEMWQAEAAEWERKALDATFGNLLQMLKPCHHLQPLEVELATLKQQRDYFAHRFFRDENRNMWTDDRRMLLIAEMATLGKELGRVEHRIDELTADMLRRWYPGQDLDAALAELGKRLKNEDLRKAAMSVGWKGARKAPNTA